jgi:CheY-like chemotaxis protein
MAAATLPRSSARPVEVLLVEDNPGDVSLLRAALEEGPFQINVHVAINAIQAFWFLSKKDMFTDAPTPDVIVLDLQLPVIPGSEVLRTMKARPVWRDIPVIVLTSSSLEYDRAAALKGGAIAFYTKPKTWDECLDLAGRFVTCAAAGFGRPTGLGRPS